MLINQLVEIFMKPKYLLFFLLSLYILNSTFSIATVRYVSKSGTSTPPYTSWETAADSIQKCINICSFGDTVYVGVGTYIEKVIVNRSITLIGMSMDSVIINGVNAQSLGVVEFSSNGKMENFTVMGNGTSAPAGIYTFNANIVVRNCRVNNIAYGIVVSRSSSLVENCIISNCSELLISDECGPDTCHSIYRNNIILSSSASTAVSFSFGGTPTFTDNILIEEGDTWTGIEGANLRGAKIKNNLVAGYYRIGIAIDATHTDTAYAISNNIVHIKNAYGAFSISGGHRTQIKNNIISNASIGIEGLDPNDSVKADYNLFWNVENKTVGYASLGDSNIVADPMFVRDTIPTANGIYDFHLQKFSPAIDKGDPSIQDVDGSRSDIGMFGGPFGETYTYQDLAPLAPRNLSANVDSISILVKWNRNTEADTSYYKVYRDTVSGFTIDSTKLVSSSADTFYVQPNPRIDTRYVYRLTCVDSQGNESEPSVELVVNITSVSTDDYPMTISDYVLYQNYPNPFNPSTKIGYQLKERAYVKLMVYDIKGELISVLVNKEQNAGYYEVEFSSFSIKNPVSSIKGLASGIYIYRIEVIGEGRIPVYTDMKKMILIK
jgi:hypothetical protein